MNVRLGKDLGTGNPPIGNQLTEEILVTVYQIHLKSSFVFSNVSRIFRLQKFQLGDLPGELTDFSNL